MEIANAFALIQRVSPLRFPRPIGTASIKQELLLLAQVNESDLRTGRATSGPLLSRIQNLQHSRFFF